MKTLLQRIKTVIEDDSTLAGYVNKVEVCAPAALPALNTTDIPFVGIAPGGSVEQWKAQRKEATHTVYLYCAIWLQIQETAILGSTQEKGLLDLVSDTESAVRGSFFASSGSNYLSKPADIVGVDYSTAPYGDNYYLIVGTITLECVRLFNV